MLPVCTLTIYTSSSSFYLKSGNKAHNIHRRHTDRQIEIYIYATCKR